jgi:hypothetical protein
VAARDREQRLDRIGQLGRGAPDLGGPGLVDPRHDGQRQVVLAGEQVIQRAPGVAGVAGHPFEHQVGVAVLGQPAGGGLEERGAALRAPVRLRAARGLCRGHHINIPTDMYACYVAGMERPRLPIAAHTAQPWRIHEIAPDFGVEDVWALPTPGGPGDLPRLVAQLAAGEGKPPGVSRALFAVRERLGALAGWDRPGTGVGARVRSLRDRLPADLRDGPRGPDLPRLPFRSVYLTDTEWAAEIANSTVHAVLHIGWVRDADGGHRGQMAVLVKPNGLLGRVYMAAITPFRHLIVYPALVRSIGRTWRSVSP